MFSPMSGRLLSFSAASVLRAIADGVRYGFDIMDRTELPSGTVYPALSRLERDGFVKSHGRISSKAHGDRRPPRRYYRITARRRAGAAARNRAVPRAQAGARTESPRPARSRA